MTRVVLAATMLALAAPAAAVESAREGSPHIESIGVLYDVDAPFGQRALSLSVVRRDGGAFVYETYSRGLGLARLAIASDTLESTRFDLNESGLVEPLAYLCRSCDFGQDGLTQISYDWETNNASYSDRDDRQEFELRPRAMDRKAWEIQTMLDLGAQRTPGEQPTLEEGKLKLYNGENLGRETLSTRAGELETVKYRRQREGSDNFQFIWYARELGWLPARWEIWNKGKRRVIIEAFEFGWGEDAAETMRRDWLDK